MNTPLRKPYHRRDADHATIHDHANHHNHSATSPQILDSQGEIVSIRHPHFVGESVDNHKMLWSREKHERLCQVIRDAVLDPRLNDSIVVRVVDSVQFGQISGKKIGDVLRDLEKRKGIRCRGAYFVGAMKRIYRESGVPW